MSVDKFKFVSPGVFVDEIDNSQVPATSQRIGPCIIGRTERGPSMRPVRIESFSDYINVFGNPIPGGQGGDVWRDGNYTAPTYAAYAAQAYLRNNGPVTMVRLLGTEAVNRSNTDAAKAGWNTSNAIAVADASNGGAYGLFIIPESGLNATTGTLAAVWYVESGAIALSGALRNGTIATNGTASNGAAIESITVADASNSETVEFKCVIRNSSGTVIENVTFNFNKDSQKFIRNVFNTNPTLVNSSVASSTKTYWLGETFESNVSRLTNDSTYFGVMLGLASGSYEGRDYKFARSVARTGWFFAQDLSNDYTNYNIDNMQKLFRFETLETGEWDQKNLKISIEDVKKSTNVGDNYGSFSVVIRKVDDTDEAVRVVEKYSKVNLNPNSENYIARVIGDSYLSWDDTQRRYKRVGNFPNVSKFIRVDMNVDVDAGTTNAFYLPFGVYGPPRFKPFLLTGSHPNPVEVGDRTTEVSTLVLGNNSINSFGGSTSIFVNSGSTDTPEFLAAMEFPSMRLRASSEDGYLSNPKDAYFGVSTTLVNSTRFDRTYLDLTRVKPASIDSFGTSSMTEYSWKFTLDDLVGSGAATPTASDPQPHATWTAPGGARAAGTSISAVSGGYEAVLDSGWDRFTSPLFGGHDGLDITEQEPFRNTLMSSTSTPKTSYVYNTLKRAIDTVSDPEVVDHNILLIPGCTNHGITEHAIKVCEDRGDSIALIDLQNDFVPSTENTSTLINRIGTVDTAVSTFRARGINSSYAAAYYPWCQIRDSVNPSKNYLWVPPSVIALGVLGYSEAAANLWFAPAGFTRGGLSNGGAGLDVIQVIQKLTKAERDKLYEANINPIASFPAEGIVMYGQKTLQTTKSALDRINVRRLMNYAKKEISRMAATTLFDQNVSATWARFRGRVEPFLTSIKAQFGLEDFRVQLDSKTTTADLIDRNIMYAKIFLKPAKAIEFIALDFVVTDSGAAFND